MYLLLFYLFFRQGTLLCSSGWPQTQVLSALVSWELGLQPLSLRPSGILCSSQSAGEVELPSDLLARFLYTVFAKFGGGCLVLKSNISFLFIAI